MPVPAIGLIAGLGNPGSQYAQSRHNAGFWFIQALQQCHGFTLQEDRRYRALVGDFVAGGATIRVIAPQTFMNLSGDSVVPYARFFRIPAEQVLVAHDELDLPPGAVRFKLQGGHGGHNGLRDIMQKSGARDIRRLRIGIGHPGPGSQTTGYVLSRPADGDRAAILAAIDRAVSTLPDILQGDFPRAMNFLHSD